MEATYQMDQSTNLQDTIQDTSETFTNRLTGLSHTVGEKSKEIASATDECVHRHAWKAAGLMALMGLAAGIFLHRR
jgi:ElaB/YqjD/DUF883 family membrane-anchored ribosome-binding protein